MTEEIDKYLKYGKDSLSDAELLSVILETDESVAKNLLRSENLYSLITKPKDELMQYDGMTDRKLILLRCITEILKRTLTAHYTKAEPNLLTADKLASYYMTKITRSYPHTTIVALNSSFRLICDFFLCRGVFKPTGENVKKLFEKLFSVGAVYFVLVYKKTGDVKGLTSENLSRIFKLKQKAEIIGIEMRDFIIINDKDYLSFTETDIWGEAVRISNVLKNNIK